MMKQEDETAVHSYDMMKFISPMHAVMQYQNEKKDVAVDVSYFANNNATIYFCKQNRRPSWITTWS